MSEPINLDEITPLEQGVLCLLVPGTTNKLSGWDVTFAGPSHPKTIAQSKETARKFLDESARIQQARVNNKKYKVDEKQPDAQRREFAESIVARILTWTPVTFGGKTYDFDPNNEKAAIDLLLEPKLGGYVSQMSDYLFDEKSFMPASATS